ncbi:tripartite tricarboxylate transporter substrate binding protein [Achromobacter denitrificans]|uniref:Tripartite tricarboxylate transporter substrate binding protein n=1 Tax=Achromobacter denitrificans TaxID=32002 RepID=A0ABZ3FXM2_ACHDE|nr:tripartite tricarboxylate transporter substrate binding protein [Achromobacter denitrificans]MDX3877237.1 tripartite tricarboxylate transporter substrate binding protein [Achromobacter sp.]MPT45143.1 tripartite tricarboxylate transporter substrate binding protein [Klebsiella sp.]MBV2159977.1 tripartite tricarboxylate transporter substrate binding protein [Achromobacter denitrificans]QCS63525.1 tripartite tricarboxylate transporter substrate binding protein [Achromobacter denitrificans]WFC68
MRWNLPARVAALFLAAFAAAPLARAEDYPSRKPLSLIVPYPAGGASDASARQFGVHIAKALKQQVVVENVGGGAGMLGARRVLSSPPDGYTFLHGSPNEVILSPFLNAAAHYKPEDFRLTQPISEATIVLLARADLPVSDVDEFIAYAKRPGARPLTFASVGVGSLYHIMTEYLGRRVGAEFLHVPYRGGAPALQDLIGRQVDFAVLPYQQAMEGMAAQQQLKILTSFSDRLPAPLSRIPLISQSKTIPSFVYTIAGGYYVRQDTPAAEVAVLHRAVGYALGQPDLRQRMEAEGRLLLQPMSQQDADAYAAAQIAKYREMIQELGLKPM